MFSFGFYSSKLIEVKDKEEKKVKAKLSKETRGAGEAQW